MRKILLSFLIFQIRKLGSEELIYFLKVIQLTGGKAWISDLKLLITARVIARCFY